MRLYGGASTFFSGKLAKAYITEKERISLMYQYSNYFTLKQLNGNK